MRKSGWVLPTLLLIPLLAWSWRQLRSDQPPLTFTTASMQVELGTKEPQPGLLQCTPSDEVLSTELAALQYVHFSGQPCAEDRGTHVLEEWLGGRLLWSPGNTIRVERW